MNVDGGNATIMTGTYGGSNLLFENNLLAGGSYAILRRPNRYTNVQVLGNHFSTIFWPNSGWYGPLINCSARHGHRQRLARRPQRRPTRQLRRRAGRIVGT